MRYDVFFSISQTSVDGRVPAEADMFRSFFQQVELADAHGVEQQRDRSAREDHVERQRGLG